VAVFADYSLSRVGRVASRCVSSGFGGGGAVAGVGAGSRRSLDFVWDFDFGLNTVAVVSFIPIPIQTKSNRLFLIVASGLIVPRAPASCFLSQLLSRPSSALNHDPRHELSIYLMTMAGY